MTPLEANARLVVGVMVQHFPAGATANDLQRHFEKETGLARQSFFNALHYVKAQGWFVGGGKKNRLYSLNADGSWKTPPSTGETVGLNKDQLEYLVDSKTQRIDELQSELERLRDWSNGGDANGVNTALSSLLRIIADSGASVRQRIRASAAVLGYKTEGDIADFVKKYLTSLCEDTDVAYDYRIEAGELLRKHEAPRVVSETIKPSYRDETPKEPSEPLRDVIARRKARADLMQLEAIERMEREANPSEQHVLLALLRHRSGNGGDGTPEVE